MDECETVLAAGAGDQHAVTVVDHFEVPDRCTDL